MENLDHRTLAATNYNRCFELLEEVNRSAEQNVELLTSAFTSRYHWREAGGNEQWVTSDWMVARVAGALGHGLLALSYAQRAYDAAQDPRIPDWLLASTAEGMARAYAVLGDVEQRNAWCLTCEKLIGDIRDDDDRSIIAQQLASVLR